METTFPPGDAPQMNFEDEDEIEELSEAVLKLFLAGDEWNTGR